METKVNVADSHGTRWFASRVGKMVVGGDLIVLTGGLGAGKTTFTQGLASGMGVRGRVTSPTYIVSRIHEPLGDGLALVHVDAYRVEDDLDLETIDLEATGDDSVTVVEWGAGKVERLAEERLEITIEFLSPPDTEGQAWSEDAQAGDFLIGEEPRLITLRPVGEGIRKRLESFLVSPWVGSAPEQGVRISK